MSRCAYLNCNKTSKDISVFKFPVHDKDRVLLWISHSGNTNLMSLTDKELSNRVICAAHFSSTCIHRAEERCRLIGKAVPIHYQPFESDGPSHLETYILPDILPDIVPSPKALKLETPTEFYIKTSRPTVERADYEQSSSTSTVLFGGPISTPYQVKSPLSSPSRNGELESQNLSRKLPLKLETPTEFYIKTSRPTVERADYEQSSSTSTVLFGGPISTPYQVKSPLSSPSRNGELESQNLSRKLPLKLETPTEFYIKGSRPTAERADYEQSSSTSTIQFGGPISTPYQVKSPLSSPSRNGELEESQKLSRKLLFVQTQRKKNEQKLKRKIKALQLKVHRLSRKTEMQKSCINLEKFDFPTEVSKTFTLMQLKKKKVKQLTKEEQNFCLSLYNKSPAAYRFLREQGVVLASPSTIQSWLYK